MSPTFLIGIIFGLPLLSHAFVSILLTQIETSKSLHSTALLQSEISWVTSRNTIYSAKTITNSVATNSMLVTRSTLDETSRTVTAQPSPGTSSASDYDIFVNDTISVHNKYRSLHGASPLVWSDELYKHAQAYANEYNCNGTLIHSHSPYGENIALGFNTSAAVKAWYDEIKLYNFDNPGFSEETGHFTQVVWKNSTIIGCGYIYCGSYFGQYTICNYEAPGNVAGEYSENVLP
ncbi:LAFE_0C12090g1_1 [Lachancea fermentati]|uniref:LAFE_0C12090g1_1 n=1 Tax=Lachancea fermentati TaxID=4955 RepID=A0A1G4MAA1_LACFM|nr:LAFE_0C12090g1_1 [Lachancea fermentati]